MEVSEADEGDNGASTFDIRAAKNYIRQTLAQTFRSGSVRSSAECFRSKTPTQSRVGIDMRAGLQLHPSPLQLSHRQKRCISASRLPSALASGSQVHTLSQPADGKHRILVVLGFLVMGIPGVQADSFTTVDASLAYDRAFFGAAAVGDTVVFSPRNADEVGLLDVNTMTYSSVSTGTLVADNKFFGAVAIGTKVVFVPGVASVIGVYDVSTGAFDASVSTGTLNVVDYKFWGLPLPLTPPPLSFTTTRLPPFPYLPHLAAHPAATPRKPLLMFPKL